MTDQAVILAGGLGTRLKPIVPDRPKAMADCEGYPFLAHQLRFLRAQGIGDVVLCVGHLAEQIMAYCGDGDRWGLRLRYSREVHLLGTGGAVKLAEPLLQDEFLLLNGDTFLTCNLALLRQHHAEQETGVTLTVCPVPDVARFGSVTLAPSGLVTGFREKEEARGSGLVNAGFYVVRKAMLTGVPGGQAISLERDLLPGWVARGSVGAFVHEPGFIDIGTPEGYAEFLSRHCLA